MYLHCMNRRRQRGPRRRTGRPFMLYLRTEQLERLDRASKLRHVPKSELVRLAIDRFLASLESKGPSDRLGVAL